MTVQSPAQPATSVEHTYDATLDVFTASLNGRNLATYERDYDDGSWLVTYGAGSNWCHRRRASTEAGARAWIDEHAPLLADL